MAQRTVVQIVIAALSPLYPTTFNYTILLLGLSFKKKTQLCNKNCLFAFKITVSLLLEMKIKINSLENKVLQFKSFQHLLRLITLPLSIFWLRFQTLPFSFHRVQHTHTGTQHLTILHKCLKTIWSSKSGSLAWLHPRGPNLSCSASPKEPDKR